MVSVLKEFPSGEELSPKFHALTYSDMLLDPSVDRDDELYEGVLQQKEDALKERILDERGEMFVFMIDTLTRTQTGMLAAQDIFPVDPAVGQPSGQAYFDLATELNRLFLVSYEQQDLQKMREYVSPFMNHLSGAGLLDRSVYYGEPNGPTIGVVSRGVMGAVRTNLALIERFPPIGELSQEQLPSNVTKFPGEQT